MMSRVAVVTGGNKGLGFAIVKGLCNQFDGIVYLTARSDALGEIAVKKLEKVGLRPRFHQLDISDDTSVERFRDHLTDTHGGLDLLINNAGIAFQTNAPEKFPQRVVETLKVNYFGVVRICKALFPLLRPHARVVHVTSSVGHLSKIPGNELRATLSDPKLTEEELSQLMTDFIEAAHKNTHRESGWPNSSYAVSKVGISALNRIHQKQFDADPREDIAVNAVHPGPVISDMSDMGVITPEEGAKVPIYLALLPKNTDVKGKYVWFDKSFVDWVHGEVKSFRPDSPNAY